MESPGQSPFEILRFTRGKIKLDRRDWLVEPAE